MYDDNNANSKQAEGGLFKTFHHAVPQLGRSFVPVKLRYLDRCRLDEASAECFILVQQLHLVGNILMISRVNKQGGITPDLRHRRGAANDSRDIAL